ncbi:PLP-dependent cysteine synthase family protein [Microbacterium sp. 18062]|uniref:PLP-dependent cysteine synthase family protein n=1 Tax=Microbacterium sp. 18062 TaxID=2681410 RepID=UPI0013579A2D|nr:cysteine synthase family protein [Microbacterium sp. 18062]
MTALPPAFPDPSAAGVYDSVLQLIGNTPLVRLNVLTADLPATVYVKLDHLNIGGSSKDRIGLHIVRRAIESGALEGHDRIIETGQGNTSVSLALAGLLAGYASTVIAKPDLSPQKLALLRALGADIVPGRLDVPKDDPEHAWVIAEEHERDDPRTWWSRQQSIESNPEAHYLSTGPEIWAQTGGRITHFVTAIATGGTVSGTGRFLREQNPDIEVVGTSFDLPEKPWAENHLNQTFHRRPGYEQLERDWADNIDLETLTRLEAREKGEIIDFAFRLARAEGLLLGPSSVLSVKIALELAVAARPGDVIVAFSADHARDYTSAEYDGPWLREHGFAEIADRWLDPASADAGNDAGADTDAATLI